jgi:hypothetical protein
VYASARIDGFRCRLENNSKAGLFRHIQSGFTPMARFPPRRHSTFSINSSER